MLLCDLFIGRQVSVKALELIMLDVYEVQTYLAQTKS